MKNVIEQCLEKSIRLTLDEAHNLKINAPKGALTPELVAQIKSAKPELVAWLQSQYARKLSKRPSGIQALPLSFAQKRIWLSDQLQGGSIEYNMLAEFTVSGRFDVEVASRAFRKIINRHEILRTVYRGQAGEATQHILQEFDFSVVVHDLTSDEAQLNSRNRDNLIQTFRNYSFALDRDLMLKVAYIIERREHGQEQGILLINVHHIAADGWSLGILMQEFMTLYRSDALKTPEALPQLAFQYGDFSHWQHTWLQGAERERQLNYWQQLLTDAPVMHQLPTQMPRPQVKNTRGKQFIGQLPASTANGLLALGQQLKMTPFMLIHSAFSLLIARLSGNRDVLIGTPITSRPHRELDNLIGFFVNTLVLRTRVQQATVQEYLAHVREQNLLAYEHQDTPFEDLVEILRVPRTTAHTPLFQLLLTTNTDLKGLSTANVSALPGVSITERTVRDIHVKFDIELDVKLDEQGAKLTWGYDTRLFSEAQIVRFSEHLTCLLDQFSKLSSHPDRLAAPLDGVSIFTSAQSEQLRTQLSGGAGLSQDMSLVQLLAKQVKKYKHHTAVTDSTGSFTYQQLDERASHLASILKQRGWVTDAPIAICMPRSRSMLVAILAVMKAGAAYLPLDPNYPQARISAMLEDAGVQMMLIANQQQAQFEINCLALDELDFDAPLALFEFEQVTAQQLAYVIFTSGSTGRPKGVMIEHGAVVNFLLGAKQRLGLDEHSEMCWLAITTLSFDIALLELMMPLLCGGRCIIAMDEQAADPQALVDLAQQQGVNYMQATPAMWQLLMEAQWRGPNVTVLCGGEALPLKLAQELHDASGRVINCYGPTEATIWSMLTEVSSTMLADKEVLLGHSLAGYQHLVLNDALQPVPAGGIGELYIAGCSLASGYLGRDDLTQERFFSWQPDPEVVPIRLYKTGDLVRLREDGQLAFIGRQDDQVKIRGYRIELGEIAAVIESSSQVEQCVVCLSPSQEIIAYIKFDLTCEMNDNATDYQSIRTQLAGHLPPFMHPNQFVTVDEWPLTNNGKVDKKALPLATREPQSEIVTAQTELENELTEIWAGLLNLDAAQLGVTCNLFELGAHSVLVLRFVSRIARQYQKSLHAGQIFAHATIRELASLLSNTNRSSQTDIALHQADTDTHPLSYGQLRMWLIARLQAHSAEYNMFTAIRLEGTFDLSCATEALRIIIDRHDILRASFVETQTGPRQTIRSHVEFAINHVQLDLVGGDKGVGLTELIQREAGYEFDLANELLLRVTFVTRGDPDSAGHLLFNMHHIVSDGWSLGILVEEFQHCYLALQSNQKANLPALTRQYLDYIYWQHETSTQALYDNQRAYWQQQLADAPVVHNLPLQYPRPATKQSLGKRISYTMPSGLLSQLKQIAKSHDLTLFMLLHACLALLLARHSGREDIVLGTAVANRRNAQVEPLIGLFINTLALRVSTRFDTLNEYFTHVRSVNIAAQDNQDLPFEQLLDALSIERSTQYSPLFQVLFGMDTSHDASLTLQEVQASSVDTDYMPVKFDLEIDVAVADEQLHIDWLYDISLFDESYIARLQQHFATLLAQVCAHPTGDLKAVSCVPQAELQRLMLDFNRTQQEYPREQRIEQLFEQRCQLHPEHIALIHNEQRISYHTLSERVSQLAEALNRVGATQGGLIGLYGDRNMALVISMLAVLKSGAAYVPIDPANPAHKTATMIADAGITLLIDCNDSGAMTELAGCAVRTIEQLLHPDDNDSVRLTPDRKLAEQDGLAYVMYTSGSSGKPKGVMVGHHNILKLVTDKQYFAIDTQDVMAYCANPAFDASTWEIYTALLNGASLAIVDNATLIDANRLTDYLTAQKTTILQLTAGLFNQFGDTLNPLYRTLRYVLFGGDKADIKAVSDILNADLPVKLVHTYGPTETVAFTTLTEVRPAHLNQGIIPIGKIMTNSRAYVLDSHQQPVPLGAVGELCIGGEGVGFGYLNLPEQTREKFIELTLCDGRTERLYKTGDLVYYLPDGDLVFMGRIDDQVKISGYRIEMDEIEQAIYHSELVSSCFVMARAGLATEKTLVAYLEPPEPLDEQQQSALIQALKAELQLRLANYMVPRYFVFVDALPLTANGKVDRRALPEPTAEHLQSSQVPLETDTERLVAKVWSETLRLPEALMGAETSFFELGGNSLLLTQLSRNLAQACGLEQELIGIRELFTNPQIRAMANYLDALLIRQRNIQTSLQLNESNQELEQGEF
ncbi:amino acid adenylation domain-containing protein [Pseudoalteromonas luteoviolacea]|uniref:non-ribosomal peptide synthetase n=1 Tax=Pseudoalteromonas luteoviolacea TaxID=43657 RepID=UPI001B39F2EE|nr:non-ribosomal peptide synthetase [Pseudoalteromonas luteoviolacea]MBQ4878621.1 amino acid adenylation domain-containing protein [Pseudoalteromonas luteoviolacea]MBQ4907161.1 amino acid adenylation domain-containing protein [Pseudoalteromonas luteoviolacea]